MRLPIPTGFLTKTRRLNTIVWSWPWHHGHCISDMFTKFVLSSTYQSLCLVVQRVLYPQHRRAMSSVSIVVSHLTAELLPFLPDYYAFTYVCRGSSRSSYGMGSEAFPNCSSASGCPCRICWTRSNPLDPKNWWTCPPRMETHLNGTSLTYSFLHLTSVLMWLH